MERGGMGATIFCDDNDFLNCFMNVSVSVRKFTNEAQMLENKWQKIAPGRKRWGEWCGSEMAVRCAAIYLVNIIIIVSMTITRYRYVIMSMNGRNQTL